MNEQQYKLVKTFLDGFKVKPAVLARKWKIDPKLVTAVSVTNNFEQFTEILTGKPYEDILMGL